MQIDKIISPTPNMQTGLKWWGMRDCEGKKQFISSESADFARQAIEWRHPMMQLKVYWCPKHSCWHTSHKEDLIAKKRDQMKRDYIFICNILAS